MLTPQETRDESRILTEDYRRLNPDRAQVLADTQLTNEELDRVLMMDNPDPSDVWMVRDYLVEKLEEAGKEPVPMIPKMADHTRNHWFEYRRPWRTDGTADVYSLHWYD